MEKLPKIAQKSPYVDEKCGKRAFCSCGLSSKNPYCDGSHKETGFSPEIIEFQRIKKWLGVDVSTLKKALFVIAHINIFNQL